MIVQRCPEQLPYPDEDLGAVEVVYTLGSQVVVSISISGALVWSSTSSLKFLVLDLQLL